VHAWIALLSAGIGACSFHSAPASQSTADASAAAHDGGGVLVSDAGDPLDAVSAGDAPPRLITLSETTSDVVTPGIGAICNDRGGRTSADETWYRVFRPADFQVTTDFHVTSVKLASSVAKNARGIGVRIGTYDGTLGADSLTPAAIHVLATAILDAPDSPTPQAIAVPIEATIPAGTLLIVEVAAPDLGTAGGMFYLGATSGGEIQPGYFSSDACFKSLPQSEAALGVAGHFVIEVVGQPR
jgi:hypothetical protein